MMKQETQLQVIIVEIRKTRESKASKQTRKQAVLTKKEQQESIVCGEKKIHL